MRTGRYNLSNYESVVEFSCDRLFVMDSQSFSSSKSGSPSAHPSPRPVPAGKAVLPPQVPRAVTENWFRKQGGRSGWFVSLGLHGVVLLCLAGITIDPQIIHAPAIQIEQPISEPEP